MWSAALGVALVVAGIGAGGWGCLFCIWLAFLLKRPRRRRRSLCILSLCARFGIGVLAGGGGVESGADICGGGTGAFLLLEVKVGGQSA